MILRPIVSGRRDLASDEPAQSSGFAGAWEVIAGLQRQHASEWWLITQPEHAQLSGALAAAFTNPQYPRVSSELVEAIAVHDSGWAELEGTADSMRAPALDPSGKPISFREVPPDVFLQAWAGSIQHAAETSATAGILVSRHFSRLGEHRLNSENDFPEDRRQLKNFLEAERRRQDPLMRESGESNSTLERLVDLLQFCDLLSLYLCAGASEAVQFPESFSGKQVRIQPRASGFLLEPSPFQAEKSNAEEPREPAHFSVPASYFPAGSARTGQTTLSFLLW